MANYLKKCILTPTFSGHFQFIKKYLKSFDMYVEDKDFPIFFVVSREDLKEFEKIVSPYNNLNITTLVFDDLLRENGIEKSPKELLNSYDKYCYQTMKKLYAIKHIDCDKFLMLDSETMWIRQTNMNKLFDDYFLNPNFGYSSLSKREIQQPFQKILIDNINYLFNKKDDKWFLETFSWFIEKDILNDIFSKFGDPMSIVLSLYEYRHCIKEDAALFEGLLYYRWICENNKNYNYNIIDIDDLCSKYLGDKKTDYMIDFRKKFKCNGGLIEFFSKMIDKNNYKLFINMFNDNNFNIIRFEDSFDNYRYQIPFIKGVKPYILTVSQEHFFGINDNIKFKIIKTFSSLKEYKRIDKSKRKLIGYLNEMPLISAICKYVTNISKSFLEIIKICTYLIVCISKFIYKITFLMLPPPPN